MAGAYAGMTVREMGLYETLLREGSSTISHLSKKAKLNQRSTYDYIERLIYKGLVGQIMHNGKRMFLALNPDMLGHYVDEEKARLEDEMNLLEELVRSSQSDVQLNIISSRSDFMKLVRRLSFAGEAKNTTGQPDTKAQPAGIFLGSRCDEVTASPYFTYFAAHTQVSITRLHTSASVMAIFFQDYFIVYSIPDSKGFFIKNKEFSDNMLVYFR